MKSSRSCMPPCLVIFLKMMSREFETIFQNIFPETPHSSPHYLTLLHSFEQKLALSFNKLISQTSLDNVLSLSWMKLAMESIRQTHDDINSLFIDLGISFFDLDEETTQVYQSITRLFKYLCKYFTYEIRQLRKVSRILNSDLTPNTSDFAAFLDSLNNWENPFYLELLAEETCSDLMESINTSLKLPSIKLPTKGSILTRAFYGLKVKTLLVSSIFTSAFSNSPKKLVELHVPKKLPWADAFTILQSLLNEEMRFHFLHQGNKPVLKELQLIVLNISPEAEAVETRVSDIKKAAENFSNALDLLSKEMKIINQMFVEGFVRVLTSV